MARVLSSLSLLSVLVVAGCHSAFIETDIVNAAPARVTLIELDYPDASFGVGALAPGATMHYRLKVQGSGATKLLWTDAAGHDHTAQGPELHEGQQGMLRVTITAETPQWATQLNP